MSPVMVSACLLGVHCRYDGDARPCPELIERLRSEGRHIVPMCPEQLGGLSTPRPSAEITHGDGRTVLAGDARVVADDGTDVTELYLRGAQECVDLARRLGCCRAYLQERSPACGVGKIKRRGRTCAGMGVAAAMLEAAGVELIGVEARSAG